MFHHGFTFTCFSRVQNIHLGGKGGESRICFFTPVIVQKGLDGIGLDWMGLGRIVLDEIDSTQPL